MSRNIFKNLAQSIGFFDDIDYELAENIDSFEFDTNNHRTIFKNRSNQDVVKNDLSEVHEDNNEQESEQWEQAHY